MKLKKLDRRMNGFGNFTHFVDFRKAERKQFLEIRNWCWEQWGPSAELEHWDKIEDGNPAWAWDNREYDMRIYLAEQQQVSWYILRWGS